MLHLLKFLNLEGDVLLWRKGGNVEAVEGRRCVWYLMLKITAFVILGEDWNLGPAEPLLSISWPSL